MALYLISYDIAEKDAFEYGPLWDLLKEIGANQDSVFGMGFAGGNRESGCYL